MPAIKKLFIAEFQIYQLLNRAGINTPKHYLLKNKEDLNFIDFALGDAVVVKGLGENLWHKSEAGAVHFCHYDPNGILALHHQMKQQLNANYPWLGTLVSERVAFQNPPGIPSEIFVSLQRDKCCGAVISVGFGGLLTEEWAKELKKPLLVWPSSVYSPQEAFDEIANHWLGRLLLGNARQQQPMLTRACLLQFFESLWSLDALMAEANIELLEVNPFVVTKAGQLMALDGVGVACEQTHRESCPVPVNQQSLLAPHTIAIAGVSDRPGNVGAMILNNIQQSRLSNQQLRIIKPGAHSVAGFDGIKCLSDITQLAQDPVDMLILALPAPASVEIVMALCQQGCGANVVYLVAGGIGDGADKHGFGQQLQQFIAHQREHNLWCPAIIGPNGLGMINAPLKLNTLFIPQEKLNIQFCDDAKAALISQSGAFLITRLSRDSSIKLKYGFSIGNQIDIKFSDFMALIARDHDVQVLGLYVEGFAEGDACAMSKLVRQFRQQQRHVIIYKGGRSERGKAAAAGHTGAMTGDYQLQKRLLGKSGAIFVETFNQFNAVFKWLTAYPDKKRMGKISIVTNAGYETVGSMDILGDTHSSRLYDLTPENCSTLSAVLKENQLAQLVAPANPLDLTPMAGEKAYFDCVKAMVDFGSDVILLGLVPLTNQLNTRELAQAKVFAAQLRTLTKTRDIAIGIILDVGLTFEQYKQVFEQENLPVFDSMDKAVLGINILSGTGF